MNAAPASRFAAGRSRAFASLLAMNAAPASRFAGGRSRAFALYLSLRRPDSDASVRRDAGGKGAVFIAYAQKVPCSIAARDEMFPRYHPYSCRASSGRLSLRYDNGYRPPPPTKTVRFFSRAKLRCEIQLLQEPGRTLSR